MLYVLTKFANWVDLSVHRYVGDSQVPYSFSSEEKKKRIWFIILRIHDLLKRIDFSLNKNGLGFSLKVIALTMLPIQYLHTELLSYLQRKKIKPRKWGWTCKKTRKKKSYRRPSTIALV